ncbi:hypothetical protein HDU82_005906 [Entophlyctis luteolus]|nr:hypothetical protein HDU82_005906 [Entophlyctis luteolus]
MARTNSGSASAASAQPRGNAAVAAAAVDAAAGAELESVHAGLPLPLTVLLAILLYCDVRTVARVARTCRAVRAHLDQLRPNEANKLWHAACANSVAPIAASAILALPSFAQESTLSRIVCKRRWEQLSRISLTPSASVDVGNLRVIPLAAAIVAAAKSKSAASPASRVILAVNDAFSYVGPQKALHIHKVSNLMPAVAHSSQVFSHPLLLLFVQSAQPRNLQITNLETYARVPVLFTTKKPFVFRILNWTYTPFIYFVDRDSYQRRLWFYDAERRGIVPVVASKTIIAGETLQESDEESSSKSHENLIDPFAKFIDPEDATVNDNIAGFGDIVVWWTWVGGLINENNQDEEEINDEPENEPPEANQPRGPRRYELKVHAYRVRKEGFVEDKGIRVTVEHLWSHHLFLTSSTNLSYNFNANRLHIFHLKKFKPKAHTEIVAQYSFDFSFGFIEEESILEPARDLPSTEDDVVADGSCKPDVTSPLPSEDPEKRQLVGSRGKNHRIYTRYHMLEFHNFFDFYHPDGTVVDDDENDPEELQMSLYEPPFHSQRIFTMRDCTLGPKQSGGSARDAPTAQSASTMLLSLVPAAAKTAWRPSSRQVSEDSSLLLIAGVEGSRRCLRVLDVARGSKQCCAFFLDDEIAQSPRSKKKIGGGVWVVERDLAESCGFKVLFLTLSD